MATMPAESAKKIGSTKTDEELQAELEELQGELHDF